MLDPFLIDSQIEEYIPTEEDWESMPFWDDDAELEAFSLECAFGPNY